MSGMVTKLDGKGERESQAVLGSVLGSVVVMMCLHSQDAVHEMNWR